MIQATFHAAWNCHGSALPVDSKKDQRQVVDILNPILFKQAAHSLECWPMRPLHRQFVILLTSSVLGQSVAQTTETSFLNIGDPAPKLQVGTVVKGVAPSLGKSRPVVIEFWARWCQPCVANMPHLSELARKYRDKVDFIAVSVLEGEGLKVTEGIQAFVDAQGANMDFAVATDTKDAMATTWLSAAGEIAIPRSFLIDGNGRIVWIGHPALGLENAIRDLLSGTMDVAALRLKRFNELAPIIEGIRAEERLTRRLKEVMVAYETGDYERGLALCDKMWADFPNDRLIVVNRYLIGLVRRKSGGFDKLFEKVQSEPALDKANSLNQILSSVLQKPGTMDQSGYRAARKLAKRMAELAPDDYNVLDTFALALWRNGEKEEALKAQQRAVAMAEMDKNAAPELVRDFGSRLKEYSRADDIPLLGNINLTSAKRYFDEAKAATAGDRGMLWNHSLEGPMIFADADGHAVLNRPAPGFTERDGVWVGTLPKNVLLANTAIDWRGAKWTMLMWPLPQNKKERLNLMAHELWHRIQVDIGIPAPMFANAHLDEELGRLWLQLELRALALALRTNKTQAVKDALAFRSFRQSRFKGARKEEDALEMNEGLAEFTGLRLRGSSRVEVREVLADRIDVSGFDRPSYTRSFPYLTGAAYAILLDGAAKFPWRTRVAKTGSIAQLVAEVFGKPNVRTVRERAEVYGYGALTRQEHTREVARKRTEAMFQRRFIKGPVLILPLKEVSLQFDPGNVFVLKASGTVYPKCKIADEWGVLTVTEGTLISSDFKFAFVPAPVDSAATKGAGWRLDLDPGWSVVPAKRPGDYTLTKK